MSLIAMFYACDGKDCAKIFAIRNEQESDEFEETWGNGGISDFCPQCRAKAENIVQIENHAKFLNDALETVNI